MSTIVVRLVSVCGALMIAAGVARSQTKFEAASVKPCNWVTLPAGARSGGGTGPANISPGRIDLRCWNVFQLINFAYVVNGDPLIGDVRRPMDAQKVRGGPAWVYSALYEIEAKAEGTPDRKTMAGPMLQALLEDRFHLRLHRETEDTPAYALTVAKNGLKLQPMPPGGCIAAFDPATHPGFFAPGEKLPCGLIQDGGSATSVTLDAGGIGLDRISDALSGFLDRYVIDKTGGTGFFNIHLEFARDESIRALPGSSVTAGPPEISSAPSIFTALEKVGLKLESTRAQHGFIVIDHLDRPSQN